MRYLGFILVLLVGLSSCDSREDWFEHNSEGPGIVVTMNGVSDTLYEGDPKLITIDLHIDSCDDRGHLFTDTVNFVLEGLSDNNKLPIKNIQFDDGIEFVSYIRWIGGYARTNYFESNENNIIDILLYRDYFLSELNQNFDSDTTSKVINLSKSGMCVVDGFGNREYYNILLKIYGPIPPTPILKAEKLAGEYEYSLSLDDSYDKDGKVVKYEWCIDGNIAPYSATENRFECIEGNWQSGKAAYGGTYITATTLSSVNHSFQTSGEHTVYYRCMDNMGIWSMWYSKKLNVE